MSYKWTFGDGTEESGAFADVDTTHVYTRPWVYKVRLELTDDLAPEPATGVARVWITIE